MKNRYLHDPNVKNKMLTPSIKHDAGLPKTVAAASARVTKPEDRNETKLEAVQVLSLRHFYLA
jgi:hypothetical protein